MRTTAARLFSRVLVGFGAVMLLMCAQFSGAATASALPPTQLFVSPAGSDSAAGTTPNAPLRTLTAAWNRIPRGTPLASGITINLAPGTYPRASMPHYWEDRHGTPDAPIVIRSLGSPRSAVLLGDFNLFDIDHLTLDSLSVTPGGDALHCEQCSHVTVQNSRLDGAGVAQETIKVNQSDHFDIVNSDISNADENVIDFVAVQHSVITGNIIHGAGDWCAYAKGGSIDIVVRGNEIHTCGTGGFTAGQGTGLEFMVAPWLTYEAEDLVLAGNFIHDTEGAAFGVNGGRNILIENNVATRVGQRSHLIEVTFGYRSCDGDIARCRLLLGQGAWGTTATGGVAANIPNRDVTIRRNTIVNPPGHTTAWQHLEISTPRVNTGNLIGPSPARTDDGLVITGNIIRNGGPTMPLGIDDSEVCRPTHPSCTVAQILRDNDINGPSVVPIPNQVPDLPPPPGTDPPPGLLFVPIAPVRAYDSRLARVDMPSGPLVSGTHRRVSVAHGRDLTTGAVNAADAIPATAAAVAANLTITDAIGAGFLAATAGGGTQTATSLINWTDPAITIANGAPIPLAPDRTIELFAGGSGGAHAVLDIVGYFVPDSSAPTDLAMSTELATAPAEPTLFTPINPSRAYDSRADTSLPLERRALRAGTSRTIDIASTTPALPESATAIAYNITAVDTGPAGYLAVSPRDTPVVAASTLNWSSPGDTVANGTVVGLDAARHINVRAMGSSTHVIIDIVGYYTPLAINPTGATFHPLTPGRAYDSRWTGSRLSPVEGSRLIGVADGRAGADGALLSSGLVPPTVSAVAFNLTITDTRGHAGFVSVRPDNATGVPSTSTSNWPGPGSTRANASLVACTQARLATVHAGGDATTHVVLDVLGYYAPRTTA